MSFSNTQAKVSVFPFPTVSTKQHPRVVEKTNLGGPDVGEGVDDDSEDEEESEHRDADPQQNVERAHRRQTPEARLGLVRKHLLKSQKCEQKLD